MHALLLIAPSGAAPARPELQADHERFIDGLDKDSKVVRPALLAGVRNDGLIVGLDYSPAIEDRVQENVEAVHSPGPVAVRPLKVAGRTVAVIG